MKNNLFGQKKIKFLGELTESVFTAIPIIGMFNYVSTTIILWEIIKKYILDWLPWMNILYFILFLGLIFIPIVLATFKWIIPSVWHFRSTQMGHLEKKIDELTKKVDKLLAEKLE
jgi:hypothetical protein